METSAKMNPNVDETAPTIVACAKCDSYERNTVERAFTSLLDGLGPLESMIGRSDRIVVKPNLLRAAFPEQAVTTHPEILRHLIFRVKQLTDKVVIAESPAGINTAGQLRSILKRTGIQAICEELSVPFVLPDDDIIELSVDGAALYKKVKIGRVFVEADKVIGVAKLKTHALTKYTGAVKLMFGMIPGLEKARYHLRVQSPEDFAQLLLDVYLAAVPSLSIIDGVWAMEGHGPSAGQPCRLSCLISSQNAVAADIVASTIIGYKPEEISTNRIAMERGLSPIFSELKLMGDSISDLVNSSFSRIDLPTVRPTASRWTRIAKKRLVARPEVTERCRQCGQCIDICPTQATQDAGFGNKVRIDPDRCIACYCCLEVCPHEAINLKTTTTARLFDKLSRH